jgi:hypothetical protein
MTKERRRDKDSFADHRNARARPHSESLNY